jgi:acyl carrier protein
MTARALLTEVVRYDVDGVDATTPLKMIRGFDSLAMVNLVLRLEAAIDRELTETEIERLSTVGDLEALLGPR